MGLAVSHGIVASHGGFMTVESQVGAGSTFHVYLPAVTGDASNDTCGEGEDTTGGHERILVVDDEQVVLQLVSKMLASLGYEVTTFSTSSDALEALLLSPSAWDLVITDQTMPKMDGIEVLKTVRRIRSDLPVVIMTGHSDKLNLDADGGVGADAVLRKPFRLDVLANVVLQVLRRPASTRPAADLE